LQSLPLAAAAASGGLAVKAELRASGVPLDKAEWAEPVEPAVSLEKAEWVVSAASAVPAEVAASVVPAEWAVSVVPLDKAEWAVSAEAAALAVPAEWAVSGVPLDKAEWAVSVLAAQGVADRFATTTSARAPKPVFALRFRQVAAPTRLIAAALRRS
jgi:hypothetical protein